LGRQKSLLAGWVKELDEYEGMLLGDEELPIQNGVMSLMESATVMYSRAKEIERVILKGEREGEIDRGDPAYRYRTGELRSFIESCSKQIDRGSRRVTDAKTQAEEMRG
jgi:hypothetical protein